MTPPKKAPCVVAQQGLNRINYKNYTVTNTPPRQSKKDAWAQKVADMAYAESFAEEETAVLKRYFPTATTIEVVKDKERQFAGIDYVVTYREPRTGAILKAYIDAKRRRRGSRDWWKDKGDPEFCFEIRNNDGRLVSCLTDPNEATHFFLFTFEDTGGTALVSFQSVRFVLSNPLTVAKWETRKNKNGLGAVCVYVPLSEFWAEAVKMSGMPTAALLSRLARQFAESAEVAAIREHAANDNATEQQAG